MLKGRKANAAIVLCGSAITAFGATAYIGYTEPDLPVLVASAAGMFLMGSYAAHLTVAEVKKEVGDE